MPNLLVASTGGHLSELWELWPRIATMDTDEPVWVTFDTPQSRSLLSDVRVEYLRYVAPRDVPNILRNLNAARQIIGRFRPTEVFSTGSGIALAVLPLASAAGANCHYIESAARSDGPSMTGRVLENFPSVHTYSQYPAWPHKARCSSDAWSYAGSVFDGFESRTRKSHVLRRVLVTLGTIPYPFERLIAQLERAIPGDCEITWQLGHTPATLVTRGAVHDFLSPDELSMLSAESDVVVSHAGVGSSLTALTAGRAPVLVPRIPSRGEHIDGHQALIARTLSARRLAVSAATDSLTVDHLIEAAGKSITKCQNALPLSLRARTSSAVRP